MTEIRLHPVYALAKDWSHFPAFDEAVLPFEVAEGVALENVEHLFAKSPLSWVQGHMSKSDTETLSAIKYALVKRVEKENDYIVVNSDTKRTVDPLEALMALLRLIRPMREKLGIMQGYLREDGSLDVRRFAHPYNISTVPEVEKLNALQTKDAYLLRELAPTFLKASRGDYWKLRMAVEFFQAGFFQANYWKARVFFRCSAIGSIYSSHKRRGSAAEKARIKQFLGASECIYEKGDIPEYFDQGTDVTLERVLEPIYIFRNCVAHGDRIPDDLFSDIWRRGLNEPLSVVAVVDEAVSIIVRKTLLKILQLNLIEHFKSSETADAFFGD